MPHKRYVFREELWTIVRVVFGYELLVAALQGRLLHGLAVLAGQMILLVLAREALHRLRGQLRHTWHAGLRAYAHHQQRRQTARTCSRALIGLLVLGGLLQGCATMSDGVARLVGCDPVAIDYGYCTMPKQRALP